MSRADRQEVGRAKNEPQSYDCTTLEDIMFNRRKFLTTVGLAVGIGLASLASTATAQEGLTWSVHVDLTGPASYGGLPQGDGFEAFVKWKNEQGGIRGRMIDLTVTDTTFKVDVAAANLKKAMAQSQVHYFFGDSTGTMQAVSPENNSTHKILSGGGSFASELADPVRFPYYFVAGATYGDQLQLLVNYVSQTMDPSKARLAIMHSSISLGRDGIDQAVAEAKRLGIEIVLIQESKFIEADVSSFALALRQAKPTHVLFHGYSFAVWPETIRLVRDFGLDDVVFMSSMWQNEYDKIVELADVAEGLVGIKVFETDTNTGSGEMIDVIRKIHQDRDADFNGYVRLGFMDGWFNGMMASKAMEDVIDTGLEINGDNLVAAMEKISNWDTGGMIGMPASFDGHKTGIGQIIRWEKNGDAWASTPVSDWMKVE